MKEFKQKKLKGLDDLNDKKYSIQRLSATEAAKVSGAEIGRRMVESGHLKKISSKGGKTVTKKKLDKILDLNKSKRLFTEQDIIEMKELYRNDISVGFGTLAKMYDVDKVTIHNIMNNKIYVDIGGTVTIRQSKPTCPHCGKQTTEGNYVRWHGDNCKNKI